jgi:hypothetical protein
VFHIPDKRFLYAVVSLLLIFFASHTARCATDDATTKRAPEQSQPRIRWLTDQPDFRPKLAPAIWHSLILQGIGFGLLQTLDSDTSRLEDPDFKNVRRAFKHGPVWENDLWYWNYIAHPLWGSETYLRARAQGFGRFPSFLFSTASSVVWEFLFEGWSARPSTDDLLLTSTIGSLLGELRFHIKRKLALNNSKTARVLDFLVDPLHGAARAVGGWFGKDWREPAFTRVDAPAQKSSFFLLDPALIDGKVGVTMRVAWRF